MGRQVCVKQMHSFSNISNPQILMLLSVVSTSQFGKLATPNYLTSHRWLFISVPVRFVIKMLITIVTFRFT